jgi:hypothetical protein
MLLAAGVRVRAILFGQDLRSGHDGLLVELLDADFSLV